MVSEFDFTPKTVDVSTGEKQITVTARLTDETGAEAPFMVVGSDSTSQSAGFGQMALVSGTATNGLYSRTVTIPTTAAPGSWTVRLYPTEDTLGNSDSTFRTNPTKLTVTNGAQDTAPPVVSEFDFTPKTVDVSTGEKQITVTARLTDETGAEAPFMVVGSDSTSQSAGFGQMALVSGTATNGLYSRTVTIPTTAAPGSWTVRLYPTEDTLGNSDSTFRTNPTKLTVTNGAQDTAPDAPTDVTAVKGDKSAQISWTAPTNNGGSAITSYTITSTPGGITKTVPGDVTTGTITGLTNGTSYTFTVVATNTTGTSPASAASNAVTPAAVPGAPTSVTAVKGDKSAVVSWTAPANNGGSAIAGYTITSTPGGITKTVAGDVTTGTITGLTNGTSYTFTVTATNASGTSPASAASNAVTPTAPAEPEPEMSPSSPTGVKAKTKKGKVVLKWNAPATGDAATSFLITSNKGYERSLPANKTKLVIGKLKRGKYKFFIASVNEAGLSKPVKVKVRIR